MLTLPQFKRLPSLFAVAELVPRDGVGLQASVRCLGNWGKLLEIGKYDILNHTNLDMRPMLNNVAFEGIDVDRVMNHPESTEVYISTHSATVVPSPLLALKMHYLVCGGILSTEADFILACCTADGTEQAGDRRACQRRGEAAAGHYLPPQ